MILRTVWGILLHCSVDCFTALFPLFAIRWGRSVDVSFSCSSSCSAVRPSEFMGLAYSSSFSLRRGPFEKLRVRFGFASSSALSGTSSSSRSLGPTAKVRLFPTMEETRK